MQTQLEKRITTPALKVNNRNNMVGASPVSKSKEIGQKGKVESVDGNRMVLSTRFGIILVKCKDILRCEADRSSCIFYMNDGTLLRASKSLKFYESKLREWNFIKVHKSNMVNLHHIEGYVKGKGGSVILSDNTLVPVAIRKKPRLMKVFSVHS